ARGTPEPAGVAVNRRQADSSGAADGFRRRDKLNGALAIAIAPLAVCAVAPDGVAVAGGQELRACDVFAVVDLVDAVAVEDFGNALVELRRQAQALDCELLLGL